MRFLNLILFNKKCTAYLIFVILTTVSINSDAHSEPAAVTESQFEKPEVKRIRDRWNRIKRGKLNEKSSPGLASEIHLDGLKLDGQKGIYGPDNRMDWYQIFGDDEPKGELSILANATVAIFKNSEVSKTSEGNYQLKTTKLKDVHNLCDDHSVSYQGKDYILESNIFATQETGGVCSGVLVEENLILTAGHCTYFNKELGNLEAEDMRFIFGFRVNNRNDPGQTVFKPEQVYEGAEYVDIAYGEDTRQDYAFIRIKGSVPGKLAIPISKERRATEKIKDKENVFIIGHPSHLPVKYAPGSKVKDNFEHYYFKANLDVFGGNSGSGVFSKSSMKLVGILTEGGPDYIPSPDPLQTCKVVHWCPDNGCDGEEVSRIEKVKFPQ